MTHFTPSRLFKVLVVLSLLTWSSVYGAGPSVKEKSASPGNRYLFILENSSAMKKRDDALRQSLFDLVNGGVKGRMQSGDTFGLWTFNAEVNSQLPMQTWEPSSRLEMAARINMFVKELGYRKQANVEAMLKDLNAVVSSVPELTVIILSQGSDSFKGTPFDREIGTFYRQMSDSLQKSQEPFVTGLMARAGRFVAYSVGSPSEPLTLPPPPSRPLVKKSGLGKQNESIARSSSATNSPARKVPSIIVTRESNEQETTNAAFARLAATTHPSNAVAQTSVTPPAPSPSPVVTNVPPPVVAAQPVPPPAPAPLLPSPTSSVSVTPAPQAGSTGATLATAGTTLSNSISAQRPAFVSSAILSNSGFPAVAKAITQPAPAARTEAPTAPAQPRVEVAATPTPPAVAVSQPAPSSPPVATPPTPGVATVASPAAPIQAPVPVPTPAPATVQPAPSLLPAPITVHARSAPAVPTHPTAGGQPAASGTVAIATPPVPSPASSPAKLIFAVGLLMGALCGWFGYWQRSRRPAEPSYISRALPRKPQTPGKP